MATRHMTDEEIQAFLEKGTSALDQVFTGHLDECPQCRRQVQEYRALYGSLGEDRDFELAPGFSDAVMARVAAESEAQAKKRLGGMLLSVLGALAAVALIAYFVDFTPVLNAFTEMLQPSLHAGAEAFNDTRNTLDNGGNAVTIVLFAVLVIGAIAGADHLLFRGRGNRYCL